MFKKLAVISLTVGALVLTAPAVANATQDSYAAQPGVSISDPVIGVCESSTISFSSGYFQPGERVDVSVSGLKATEAKISGNTAASDGGLVLTFRPPSGGSGAYDVAFSGDERSYTARIVVSDAQGAVANCDNDPGVAPAGTELPLSGTGAEGSGPKGSGLELALTGGSVSPWALGGGAAALAAGGALVAIGAARRRRA